MQIIRIELFIGSYSKQYVIYRSSSRNNSIQYTCSEYTCFSNRQVFRKGLMLSQYDVASSNWN